MRTWPAIDVERLSEPDLLHAALTDYDVSAIDERAPDAWLVYFHTAAGRDRAAAALPGEFPALHIRRVDVPDDDWAHRSQQELRAVRIGDIIVAPPWDVPADTAPAPSRDMSAFGPRKPIVIIIRPSMGFGTGHHATTRLCLGALQQFSVKDGTVLDVGTGSGVLAIAARRLGAARVIAIDDDADAVQCARENAEINGVPIDVRVADLRTIVLGRFDLVLANLTGALLIQSAVRLQELMTRRGPIILSGFQPHEEPAVVAAFSGLRVVDRGQEDEWVSVTMRRGGAFE